MTLQEAMDSGFAAVKAFIDAELATLAARIKALEEKPAPLPARDGRDGLPGPAGRDGAPGPGGTNGKDGLDGLGFDDFEIAFDHERTVKFIWARAGVIKERSIKVPWQLYRGVFKDGTSYSQGDVVTFGGSAWVAKEDTTTKPEASAAWQLAVKRGRDGKDARLAVGV